MKRLLMRAKLEKRAFFSYESFSILRSHLCRQHFRPCTLDHAHSFVFR